MHRISFVAALVLAVVTPVTAQSIAGTPIEFGVMGGRTKPVGELSSATNNDWSLGGLMLLGAPESKLKFRVDGQWQQIAGKTWGGGLLCIGCAYTTTARSYRVLDATANAVLSGTLSGSTRVYLIGGVGIYSGRGTTILNQNGVYSSQSSTITRPGVNGGVGASFKMGSHSGFIEARYHNVFTDASFKDNAGIDHIPGGFQFVPFNVGFVF